MSKCCHHPRATWLDPASGALLNSHDLMKNIARRQVVLLGETHNIAEIHRWQLHVAAALHAHQPNMAMGFEMFPRRLQPVLDEWVTGKLSTAEFLEKSEWYGVWGFPAEIYLPLFHFCRQQQVCMLALNCYRALVTRVGKEGWDAIPVDERDGLTPSAPPTDGHRAYLHKITGGVRMPTRDEGDNEPVPDRFIRAQQTWDRAFACNIAHALEEAKDNPPLVIGIIGRGHLEYGHGTPYQLRDLGIDDVAVLLPTSESEHDAEAIRGIGDAIFRLDEPEPPVERISRPAVSEAKS